MNSHSHNTGLGNVVQMATHKRAEEIASRRAAEAAMSQFLSLMQQHGCRWVSLAGAAPDGTRFQVFSHSLVDESKPGVEFWVIPPEK
jgi:hypothetical protein